MSVGVETHGHVGVVELQSPPHNFFTAEMMEGVADALESFDAGGQVRAAVLAAQGKSFCAGADLGGGGTGSTERLYAAAARICAVATPVVAAVHGAAIGGGLGLAMTATMRVTCPEARFAANFAKIGIHHGFGLSVTLPAQLGPSKAALVLLTGRRFPGDEATELGLADLCVPTDQVRQAAIDLAGEIAVNAPLALQSINRTLRAGLADRIREATAHEAAEQARLSATDDAREGIRAVNERRDGNFTGR
jgi:enoyl-CoA hydratase/carnithine racemase